jgi:hypothetical protein
LFHDERGECQLYFPARRGLDRVKAVDERITGIVHFVVVGEVERLDRPARWRSNVQVPQAARPIKMEKSEMAVTISGVIDY